MPVKVLGLAALVFVAGGILLVLATALFAYLRLSRKPAPPGFDVVPHEAKSTTVLPESQE